MLEVWSATSRDSLAEHAAGVEEGIGSVNDTKEASLSLLCGLAVAHNSASALGFAFDGEHLWGYGEKDGVFLAPACLVCR